MKNAQKIKNQKILRRQRRVRVKILQKAELPRLSVKKSLKHFYAQVIDDQKGITLCAANDKEVKGAKKMKPAEIAGEVGKIVAGKALEKGIKQVVFDRGANKYHGRIKSAADGARDAGLKI